MKFRHFLTAATAVIALSSPAFADAADKLLVDQSRAKITTAKADATVARYGAAELSSAELLLPKLKENIDDNDKTDTQSLIRQIDTLVATAKIKAQLAVAKETAVAAKTADTEAVVANATATAVDAQLAAAKAEGEASALREQMRAMQLKQTAEGATLVLQDVIFATGSATLREGSMQRLQPMIAYLSQNANVRVQINGHTDAQGSTAYNQSLSERRAEAVKRHLVSAGIDSSRIDAIGHGEAQSVATNATAAGRQQNRRVEVTLLGQKVDTIG